MMMAHAGGSYRTFPSRGLGAQPTMLQCDQTSVLATLRIMCREEVGPSLQGRVRFVLRRRLQNGNYPDRFIGAFSARRRRLGIFAVASLSAALALTGTCAGQSLLPGA
jgi:hypothetical protein